jgi:hypothetical protein
LFSSLESWISTCFCVVAPCLVTILTLNLKMPLHNLSNIHLIDFQFLLQANCCIDSFYNPLSFLTLRWWWWCQRLKSFLMVQYYKIVLQLAFPTPFAIYIALQKLFLHNNLFQLLYGLIHVLQFYVLVFFCYFL